MPSLQHLLLGVFLLLLLTAPGHQASADQDPELQRILKAHVDAMGGWRAWNKVESIRLTGTIEREGQTYDFCIIKKRPDQIRMTLNVSLPDSSDQVLQVIRAYDGKNCWSANRLEGDPDLNAKSLAKEEALDLIENSGVLPLLIKTRENHAIMELVDAGNASEGRSIIIRAVDQKSGSTKEFFLEPSTMMVQKITTTYTGGKAATTVLSDYATYSEVKLPTHMVITDEMSGSSKMQFSLIEIGVGIYEEYFHPSLTLSTD